MEKALRSVFTGLMTICLFFCCGESVYAKDVYHEEAYTATVDNYLISLDTIGINMSEPEQEMDKNIGIRYGVRAPEMAAGSRFQPSTTQVTMNLSVGSKKIDDMDKLYGISDLKFIEAESGQDFKTSGLGPQDDGILRIDFPARSHQRIFAQMEQQAGFPISDQQRKNEYIAAFQAYFISSSNLDLSKISSLSGNLVLYDSIKKEEITVPLTNDSKEIERKTGDFIFTFRTERTESSGVGKQLKLIVYVKSLKQAGDNPQEEFDRTAVLKDKEGKEILSGAMSRSGELETYGFPVPSSEKELTLTYIIIRKSNPTRKLFFEIKNIPVLEQKHEDAQPGNKAV